MVELLIDGDSPPICRVARLFCDEVERFDSGGSAPAATSPPEGTSGSGDSDSAEAQAHAEGEADDLEEAEAEGHAAMLGASLRLLTACARDERGAIVICDAGVRRPSFYVSPRKYSRPHR